MGRRRLGPAPFDEIAVAAAVRGTVLGRLAPGDVWEIVRRMAAAGFSDGQIAYRIGYTLRQVLRIRTGLGIPSPCRGRSGLTRPVPDAPTVLKRRRRAA